MSAAIGVLLTFTTYGTHLHGAEAGSVSRRQRSWGAPRIDANRAWEGQARLMMREPEFVLDALDRRVVLEGIVGACRYRSWDLFCAHVRTNHVHVVLRADVATDRIMSYLKARATHGLRMHRAKRKRFWTKGGSARYLWDRGSLERTVDYVINEQGDPMELWTSELL